MSDIPNKEQAVKDAVGMVTNKPEATTSKSTAKAKGGFLDKVLFKAQIAMRNKWEKEIRPNMRNWAADTAIGVAATLFNVWIRGEDVPRTINSASTRAGRTSYGKYYDSPNDRYTSQQRSTRGEWKVFDYNDVSWASPDELNDALDELIEIADRSDDGIARVAAWFERNDRDRSQEWSCNNYGWTKEQLIKISRNSWYSFTENGRTYYATRLPRPVRVTNG